MATQGSSIGNPYCKLRICEDSSHSRFRPGPQISCPRGSVSKTPKVLPGSCLLDQMLPGAASGNFLLQRFLVLLHPQILTCTKDEHIQGAGLWVARCGLCGDSKPRWWPDGQRRCKLGAQVRVSGVPWMFSPLCCSLEGFYDEMRVEMGIYF